MKRPSFKEVIEIRNGLPHGAGRKIAKDLGVTPQYLSKVINGNFLFSQGEKYHRIIEACRSYAEPQNNN